MRVEIDADPDIVGAWTRPPPVCGALRRAGISPARSARASRPAPRAVAAGDHAASSPTASSAPNATRVCLQRLADASQIDAASSAGARMPQIARGHPRSRAWWRRRCRRRPDRGRTLGSRASSVSRCYGSSVLVKPCA